MLLNYLLNTFNNLILINYVEYLIHKLSHSRRFGGYLYKYHKIHHTVSFPPNRLMIEKHTENISMDQLLFGLYVLGFIIPIFKIYSYILPKYKEIFAIESVLYATAIDHLHTQYHLENSYLDKYRWFQKLKHRHHNHHRDSTKNINLGIPITDIIMHTKQD